MKTLNQILESGDARPARTDFLPSTTETDPVVRTFNNCYGLFTDTHMGKISEDEYVITGSLCSIPEKFDQFLYSVNYGLGTHFKVKGKIMSLSCFLSENGLCGRYGCLNGDKVYVISRVPVEIQKNCDYSVCQMDACSCPCPVPAQLGEKAKETLCGLVEQSETVQDLQKMVNECESIKGSDWAGFATENGFGLKSDSMEKVLLFSK